MMVVEWNYEDKMTTTWVDLSTLNYQSWNWAEKGELTKKDQRSEVVMSVHDDFLDNIDGFNRSRLHF